ncbi:Dabb family protein [Chitinimonas lacunae]|uniref:Dabb family protein n=1 Tax=Chitinimonas lacunae TaxID=1963018 RepID=A0ABV8MQT1_9NEIS
MLRHIVMWKLQAKDAVQRELDAVAVKAALEGLRSVVPELRRIEVGRNVASPHSNYDLALLAEFDDFAALQRYQNHPDYRAASAFVGTLCSDRVCVHYESAGEA